MAEDFSLGSLTGLKDDNSIRSVELSAQDGADHASLKIKQEEITLYKRNKTARVDQIPMLDGDLVRSVELPSISASIADKASDISLQVNADAVIMMYGNTDAVDCIKEKGVDDVGKHEHLLRSGQMGKCNDPFCTTCPSYFGYSEQPVRSSFDQLIRRASHYGSRAVSWGTAWMPGILHPDTKLVNQWNKIFSISSLVAIFVDPLFLFLFYVRQDDVCLVFNNSAAKAVTLVRTLTDAIHVCHIPFQFRLAYVISDSKVRRAGELEDNPKKIALHYIKGWFMLDVLTALPLPQILIWTVVESMLGRPNGANYAKNVLRVVVIVQNIPRSIRILASLLGRTWSGFLFQTARSNFVINLLMYLLAGHIVGACWYLFGLQRVNSCMHKSCENESSGFLTPDGEAFCQVDFLDCGAGGSDHSLFPSSDANYVLWRTYTSVGTNCLLIPPNIPNFQYGIYLPGIPVVMEKSILDKYIYSFVWGFVQISSLAGNQLPSTFVGEALFTVCISALGLSLAAVLIGNIQSSMQNLGQRKTQMQLKRYDTKAWMEQRRLPQLLRKRVMEACHLRLASTMGLNEQEILAELPEDLQKDIRRYLSIDSVKKVRLFELLEDHVLDAICERLSQKLYIESSEIFRWKQPVERILFIIRGKLESKGEDGSTWQLHCGDFCGEELLVWYIDENGVSTSKKSRKHRERHPLSSRTVRCLTSVEAFSLESDGLEYVTTHYKAAFDSPRVQGVIRYLSLHWRSLACRRIQKAWRASRERRAQGGSASRWPSVRDPRITRFGSMNRMTRRTD